MIIFNFIFKITLQIFFVIIFLSTLNASNIEKFEHGRNVSDYFSGTLLLNDNKYNESYKFLKRLDGLEKTHKNYSSKYLFSLINSNKFKEAFNYAKKLEKTNSASFESDLIIGVYYLKNKKFNLANKHFLKIKNKKFNFILNNFLADSLFIWTDFDNLDLTTSQKKIDQIDSGFENLKNIQKVFLNCFYDDEKTDIHFKDLISNTKTDFSRYYYFYASYLLKKKRISEVMESINYSLKLNSLNPIIITVLGDKK